MWETIKTYSMKGARFWVFFHVNEKTPPEGVDTLYSYVENMRSAPKRASAPDVGPAPEPGTYWGGLLPGKQWPF